jgi:hypothetical protein
MIEPGFLFFANKCLIKADFIDIFIINKPVVHKYVFNQLSV